MVRTARLPALCLAALWIAGGAPAKSNPQSRQALRAAAVLITVEFSDSRAVSWGTGFFVDHDGLVATAEHILYGYDTTEDVQKPLTPRRIEVVSEALQQTYVLESRTLEESFACGRDLDEYPWLDLCLFRVGFSQEEHRAVKPLRSGTRFLPEGEVVWTIGPRCPDRKDPKCHQLATKSLSVGGRYRTGGVEAYQTAGDLLSKGFSGGPLVDATGLLAGVCSLGDPVSAISKLQHIEDFTPSQYLGYFKSMLPPSAFFSNASQCHLVAEWDALTSFDQLQLSHIADRPSKHCDCLCAANSVLPGAFVPTVAEQRAEFLRCANPKCLERLATASLRAIQQGESAEDVALGTLASLADSLFTEIRRRHETGEGFAAPIWKSYGDYYYQVARNAYGSVENGGTEAASSRGLEAYSLALQLQPEQADAWRSLAGLFAEANSVNAGIEALKISKTYGLDDSLYTQDHAGLLTMIAVDDSVVLESQLEAASDAELQRLLTHHAATLAEDPATGTNR